MVLTGGYTENGYTPGDPNFFILIEKINFPDTSFYMEGIDLIFHEHQRELSHIKSINYLTPISIRKKIKKANAYDVLYHSNGKVLEVSRSNIFIVKDNIIITPRENVLQGITRATVLRLAAEDFKIEERDISIKELYLADEVFITLTTKRVLPVRKIDDHVFINGKPGGLHRHLKAYIKILKIVLPPSQIQEIKDNLLYEKDIHLFVKRDDLLHAEISGNKIRKLKYNLLQAKNDGHHTLLTFGGAYSNHIYAVAAAGEILWI